MKLILDTTDTVSRIFRASGGVAVLHCTVHNGGTWELELEHPDQNGWTALDDVTITKEDAIRFYTPQGVRFRFNGGTTGARIYVQGVEIDE